MISVDAPSRLEIRVFQKYEPYPGGRWSDRLEGFWIYPFTGFYANALLKEADELTALEEQALRAVAHQHKAARIAARVVGHEVWIAAPPDFDDEILSLGWIQWGVGAHREAGWKFPAFPCAAAFFVRHFGLWNIADWGGLIDLAKKFKISS